MGRPVPRSQRWSAHAARGDSLTDSGRPTFTATPRELFIPDRALWVHDGHVACPINRDTDPDAWMKAVYSNDGIATQLDDGCPSGDGDATSSSSMPSIMLTMLIQRSCGY